MADPPDESRCTNTAEATIPVMPLTSMQGIPVIPCLELTLRCKHHRGHEALGIPCVVDTPNGLYTIPPREDVARDIEGVNLL